MRPVLCTTQQGTPRPAAQTARLWPVKTQLSSSESTELPASLRLARTDTSQGLHADARHQRVLQQLSARPSTTHRNTATASDEDSLQKRPVSQGRLTQGKRLAKRFQNNMPLHASSPSFNLPGGLWAGG